ncbi:MAG: DNA-directed RNA polymerase subunit beta' [Candidatus Terrybacteria bacterium RIFCSPHIGHO2_01_FULL_48_17]|uniref:DNA-directed RNA polymerase subunit beta' n=1 Tax=Candidatus Terrybacteria bacterium RIFCSPHIGHO2_01_FULL_48_17 TaxID=1802362 RepID=A0A1G2PH79_9BACT|nr:MAG: DNA-directed RNA polymerase subunit beta' [Candidatus Terrybacteria bacterium RIFCSPHIGHO2_01_FULL_48_17]OHA53083.1 MAG: DNA-directed RNA polymerase subunit beta' [Candidatus Terrybacteria bacterium RIFCSPLOWO2_01_FULL_48_14]
MFERPIRVTDFDAVAVKLASPEDVRAWSHGEVTKPETINYRTQRPEKDGLFDERIFGPERDYECYCGKYKRVRFKGIVCDKCGVEVTLSAVRRERMGHIELAAPVTHIWFLRGVPSRIGMALDISLQDLEKVVYFNGYIVLDVNEEARARVAKAIEQEWKQKTSQTKTKAGRAKLVRIKDAALDELHKLVALHVLSEPEYFDLSLKYAEVFEAGTGAEAIRKLLSRIDFEKLLPILETEAKTATPGNRRKILRRLRFLRGLERSGLRPEWIILTALPVLPPELRPMVQLDGGRFATSDLNDLYRRVINRNNRLKHLKAIAAPEVIQRNEKRMLQEAVDSLIDNTMRKGQASPALGSARRPLKSLADMLRGKQGRFRQNLLGKRVDYSGRSVIVIGPELKLSECGLPKTMALELFKPFVMQKLLDREYAYNLRGAAHLIEEATPEVWGILEEVSETMHVLLNRAPTLHRLSVQAFKPVLVEGQAIQIHPLVCPAFNADFDGDQMAVHVPISRAAQKEAEEIMLSARNLLKPASGIPIAVPRQDIVLGCYVLTYMQDKDVHKTTFSDFTEATLAYEQKMIALNDPIRVRCAKKVIDDIRGLEMGQDQDGVSIIVVTTVGRVIFNAVLPENFPFINTRLRAKDFEYLTGIVFSRYGMDSTAEVLDRIQNVGFEYATLGGITWGMDDLSVPAVKPALIERATNEVSRITQQYREGLLTREEKRVRTIKVWREVDKKVSAQIPKTLAEGNPVFTIVDSGARGSWSQPNQMAGMKGLVVNPAGQIMELPILSSFKEGFNVLEFFISTHGARKGATDTALKTATAGYLTRRLVDVAQEVVVLDGDCKDTKGFEVYRKDSEDSGQSFAQRLVGRTALDDIKGGRKILVRGGECIDGARARVIEDDMRISEVVVRSPLTCKNPRGVCQMCYGWDLGNNKLVKLGEAVGIVAAQAIGEPGTQLTMRTFHTGGVAAVSDITQGLPRVEELFEARPPKGRAAISEIPGVVRSIEQQHNEVVIMIDEEKKNVKNPETKEYRIPRGAALFVKPKDKVERGQQLTEGSLDLKEFYKIAGLRATHRYILREVQRIYAQTGAVIHDKHIEIIIRQMFSRLRVKDPGISSLTMGEIVTRATFAKAIEQAKTEGKATPEATPLLLGITKASLATDSLLAAASFQETARVLIQAAVDGMVDKLVGIKENVVIGRLIPAGTGYRHEYEEEARIATELEVSETVGEGEERIDQMAVEN